MVNDEKPFPCTSPGCTMRFANEDHLSIHKKRHISLTIEPNNGSKTPNFVADETPTPTRFIRNCEEVGLFQEIGLMQNINPFDEQFRRAAEVSTLSTPTPVSTDDALHTPHVFPVSIETDITVDLPPPRPSNSKKNSLMPSLSTSECLTIASPLVTPLPMPTITVTSPADCAPPTITICEETHARNAEPEPKSSTPVANPPPKKERTKKSSNPQSTPAKTTTSTTNGINIQPRPVLPAPTAPSAGAPDALTTVLLRLPDGRLVQIPAIPVGNDPSPTMSAANSATTTPLIPINLEQPAGMSQEVKVSGMSEAKLKLKQALTKSKTATNQIQPTRSSVASDASGTDTDQSVSTLPEQRAAQSSPCKRKRGYNSASDPDGEDEESEKRRKFLERNRAAAYRSRQKRKRWVNSLEAKTAAMNSANKLLQNEVVALRSEVAQLKLQLLAHKNCPVTLAMCQQANTVSDNGLPLENESLSAVPVSSSSSGLPSVSAINSSAATRQIIILNPTNQAPSVAPLPPLPTKQSSNHMLIGSSSLVVVPDPETNPNSTTPNIVIRPNPEMSQPSVIMSLKLSDCSSINS